MSTNRPLDETSKRILSKLERLHDESPTRFYIAVAIINYLAFVSNTKRVLRHAWQELMDFLNFNDPPGGAA